jgi:Uma2 family endonuclease
MNIPVRPKLPSLEPGDRLTRDEFESRYAGMPKVKKAELLDGVVHMPSPTRWDNHALPHADAIWFFAHYSVFTPGVSVGDNGTVRLDTENEPQPDVTVVIDPDAGGRVVIDGDGYIEGAPDLVAEVSASSVSIDLNRKLDIYQRNGVREYLVWRVFDEEVDWFVLRGGQYARRAPDPADGVLKSEAFPGLWLDPAALVRRDRQTVLAALTRGLATPDHAAFAARLAAARQTP